MLEHDSYYHVDIICDRSPLVHLIQGPGRLRRVFLKRTLLHDFASTASVPECVFLQPGADLREDAEIPVCVVC